MTKPTTGVKTKHIKTMNTATLTTTSGHNWSTSINGSFDEIEAYFLGKYFPVGSFDENAPNEGYKQEQVIKVETFDCNGEDMGKSRIVETPRTDALAREALECAIGDAPFSEALELCESLEMELEAMKLL